ILGIGPWERRLRTLIEQYQLEDVIEMPGFKPSHEVKAMLDDADVFLSAVDYRYGWRYGRYSGSADGGDGVGIPVVSTVHSGIPELVEAGKSGWLVPEHDTQALAARLAEFSRIDHDTLESVITRAREKVAQDFNQQAINRQLASLLQTI
ncbi:glycosyltransferase, partial [Salmonella enterica]|uniref:glycosyltransferase n=1 Tax=Salmonella enterica TaxID=28901 RepID=UPI001F16EEEB